MQEKEIQAKKNPEERKQVKKIIIIGAGPAGLCTALDVKNLESESIAFDITVYDKRAGIYTRPGYLDTIVFNHVSTWIGVDLRDKPQKHIKDLERALFEEAKFMNINIKTSDFVRLHQDPEKPGIVVENDNKSAEIIEADFVIDCSGTRRVVVSDVNKIVPNAFQFRTITGLPAPHNFLAYVKIDKKEWETIKECFTRNSSFNNSPVGMQDAKSYSNAMIELSELGWTQFQLPRCVGIEYGEKTEKDGTPYKKVCFYLHAPSNLTPKDYDVWIQTVLTCYAGSPVNYSRMKKPSKYNSKPDYLFFKSDDQVIENGIYEGENLPKIAVLGDARIASDYFLGRGIYDAIKPINKFSSYLKNTFEEEKNSRDIYERYNNKTSKLLKEHEQAFIEEAERIRCSFASVLIPAREKLSNALILSESEGERLKIGRLLDEVEKRICSDNVLTESAIKPNVIESKHSNINEADGQEKNDATPVNHDSLQSMVLDQCIDSKTFDYWKKEYNSNRQSSEEKKPDDSEKNTEKFSGNRSYTSC